MPEILQIARLSPFRRLRQVLTLRRGLRLLTLILFTALTAEILYVVAFRNLHTVIPDRVYRSAQLSGPNLDRLIAEKGIRTVINLRGFCGDFDWYRTEMQSTSKAGISQEDITLSASRLPPPGELRRLMEVFDRTEYPIVLHCRRGSDRTGLAAALIYLLYTDATLAEGRAQCSLRYGHTGIGPAAAMDRFFELYEEYLAGVGESHSPNRMRQFIQHDYCPDAARGTLELMSKASDLRIHEPWGIQVRATNQSIRAWEFRPGRGTGVHVHFLLIHADGTIVQRGFAGQFRKTVLPGESITLTLPIPPPTAAGQHSLLVELIDAKHTSFGQLGCDPLQALLTVKP